MKISILIPTRNRLELLKGAIKTVLQQDYQDWELIISDNASEENIAEYVSSLVEPRVCYFRVNSFISVTDNWNNALAQCNGDYVIMLGDDDGLMQGYLTRVVEYLETWSYPDAIYHGAWLYAWPGVMPGYEEGYVHKLGCANFLKQKTTPFLLNTDDAKICVEGAMNFKALFDFNMQFALIKQDFIHSLKSYGPFYQSPYPDYYAMNALFLKANRILILPQPMVAIGISPKSYGNYICNQRENEGKAILNNDMEYANITGLEKIILPGTDIHTGWLLAMLTLEKNYGIEFNLQVDRKRYRLLQIVHILVKTGLLGYKQLLPLMSTREWFIYCPMITAMFFLKVLYRKKYNDYLELILDSIRTYPLHNPVRIDGKYKNMVEVCSEDPELLASAMSGHK